MARSAGKGRGRTGRERGEWRIAIWINGREKSGEWRRRVERQRRAGIVTGGRETEEKKTTGGVDGDAHSK
jgi:hypothetical protein